MEKETRNRIQAATQAIRRMLVEEYTDQLEGTFDILRSGKIGETPEGLVDRQRLEREKIVAAIRHKEAAGMKSQEAVADYIRDASFTTLNRFAALKMLEARDLVLECVSRGEESSGYKEFCGLASALQLLPEQAGYRFYLESIFDELSAEIKVLFDRRDVASALWPGRKTLAAILDELNAEALTSIWIEDETIGWIYQYFNGEDERREMREESQAPRNSRELAVRNQFFTPRYVVQFLTDNTLGRIWYEMRETATVLAENCEYMVRKPGEEFAPRAKKDPRDLRVLDPACGSGHFLLYAFELLVTIYEEAYADPNSPKSEATGRTLVEDYPMPDAFRQAIPGLVLEHNLYGVDIDARCAQIAQLALWMRAQKAFLDSSISRAERPQIRRSNVVVAEPLVADEQAAKEFVEKLNDAELRRVFTSLVDALNLAAELGLLLRIEHIFAAKTRLDANRNLFAPPDELIRIALERFLREESDSPNIRRRLFADDAAQGIGLLATSAHTFDVILMNPPFGAASESSRDAFSRLYPESKTDIYGAFLQRATELLLSDGFCGAITPRSYLYQVTFEKLRRRLLTEHTRPRLICELGLGVLDGATVRVALTVLGGSGAECSYTRRRNGQSDIDCIGEFARNFAARREASLVEFLMLPGAALLFGLSRSLRRILTASGKRLKAWNGLQSCDDFRFVRLRPEVPVGNAARWHSYLKPAAFAPYVGSAATFVNWYCSGREIKALISGRGESPSRYCNNEALYPADGAWYPDVSERGLGVARVEGSAIPSRTGIAISAIDQLETDAVVAFGNSIFSEGLIGMLTPDRHHKPSYVGAVPVPRGIFDAANELASAVRAIRVLIPARGPLDGRFRAPFLLSVPGGARGDVESAVRFLTDNCEEVRRRVSEIDGLVTRALSLTGEDLDLLSSASARGEVGEWFPFISSRDPGRELVAELLVHGACQVLRRTLIGIAVDDEGHKDDMPAALAALLSESGVEAYIPRYCRIVQKTSLREYCSQGGGLFADALAQYSASGRKAPIIWQLGTPSASYSVWLHTESLSKDTLFRVYKDFVSSKLVYEEGRLESLTRETRNGATATQRKAVAEQEAFVEELRTFVDEIKRIAPLWNPHVDDGVVINCAPLWRLVPQHKPWQKELKATWDALCAGKYDWAHLAIHLWPERVVPKCATDRSLAIAHDLEEVFWVEVANGKWKARSEPTRPIEQLVAERTSPAVKAALKSLLDAPVPAGKTRRKK
jgi:hypothetical protein